MLLRDHGGPAQALAGEAALVAGEQAVAGDGSFREIACLTEQKLLEWTSGERCMPDVQH